MSFRAAVVLVAALCPLAWPVDARAGSSGHPINEGPPLPQIGLPVAPEHPPSAESPQPPLADDMVLPIRFSAHNRDGCIHALTNGLHGIGAKVEIENFHADDYCSRRYPDTDLLGLVFDSGYSGEHVNTMTYDKYEGAMHLHALNDGELNAIRPYTWYCNGSCTWQATLYEAEGEVWEEHHPGKVLAHASVTMHAEETDNTSKLFKRFGSKIKIKKGHHYVLVQKVHSSKSIGVRTVGTGPYATSSNLNLFEFSSLYGRMSGNQDAHDRGSIGVKLYDAPYPNDDERSDPQPSKEQEQTSGEAGESGGASSE